MTETLYFSSKREFVNLNTLKEMFVNPHLVRHNDRKDRLEHACTLGYP